MKRFFATIIAAVAAAAALAAHPAHAVPIVIGTDFTAAPTNATYTLPGSSTTYQNGEGGNGGYLTIYCTGCGPFSSYGVGAGGTSHVYMVDSGNTPHEVAAYNALSTMPWNGAGMASGTFPNIQALRVQVGNLGGATYGTPLNIDLVVQGNHATANKQTGAAPILYYGLLLAANAPNKRAGLVADYEPLTFTPVNGKVVYVSPSGSDANTGTFASPLQHLQSANGAAGALPTNATGCTGTGGATPCTGTFPATQAVLRGGGYAPVGDWHSATLTVNAGRWANLFRITGVAPGSSAWQGPVQVTSYPGTPGGNVPEIAIYQGTTNSNSAGGFLGPDSARANENNYFDGTLGWDHYIEISWLIVNANGFGPRDGGPFNMNYGSDFYRLSGSEATWDATGQTGANAAKCGAVCGDGQHVKIFGNFLHDVYGSPADENHGWYPDTGESEGAVDNTFAFNSVNSIGYYFPTGGGGFTEKYGGSSINVNASGPVGFMKNIFIYNNNLRAAHKANLVFSGSGAPVKTVYAWNNLMQFAGVSAVDVSNGNGMLANGFQVFNNTISGWDQGGGNRGAFWDQGGDIATGADYRNNIIYRDAAETLGVGPWQVIDNASALGQFYYNTWFDGTGLITQTIPDSGSITCPPAGWPANGGNCGTNGQTGDPKFNNFGTGDYTLKVTSPALNYSTSTLGAVPRDFDFMIRLMSGAAWDDGAYERQ